MSAQDLRKGGPIGKGNGPKSNAMTSPGLANTTARPCSAHSDSATNDLTKHLTSHKPFGTLGAMGQGGAS